MGRLAIIGSTAKDRVGGGPARPGGAPHYASGALEALGYQMVAVTKVAREDETLLETLRARAVDLHVRVASSTVAFSHANDGDRRASSIDDPGQPWEPAQIEEWVAPAVADCDALHIGALSRADFSTAAVATLRTVAGPDRLLSFDAQGLVRPGRRGPVVEDGDFNHALLEYLDVLKFAEDEARAAGLTLDERSLGSLGVGEVLVTLGRRGAIVCAGGSVRPVSCKVVETADTTGAGDRFVAAYVAQRLIGAEPGPAADGAADVVADLLRRRAT